MRNSWSWHFLTGESEEAASVGPHTAAQACRLRTATKCTLVHAPRRAGRDDELHGHPTFCPSSRSLGAC